MGFTRSARQLMEYKNLSRRRASRCSSPAGCPRCVGNRSTALKQHRFERVAPSRALLRPPPLPYLSILCRPQRHHRRHHRRRTRDPRCRCPRHRCVTTNCSHADGHVSSVRTHGVIFPQYYMLAVTFVLVTTITRLANPAATSDVGVPSGVVALAVASSSIAAGDMGGEALDVRFRVEENVRIGTEVGDLRKEVRLRSRYSEEAMKLMTFRLLSAADRSLFELDESTGVVTVAADIDRDSPSLCRQKDVCEVHLDVITQPSQYSQIIKVTVEILDVNDNSPKFRETQIYLPIVEAAIIGSVYVLPTASDEDSPSFGVQRYELDSTSNKFGLQSSSNVKADGVIEIKLVLREKLDRESEGQHRLKLIAYDGGPTARSGIATITINVLDSNDNKPTFSKDQYDVDVVENSPMGTVVLRVQATDRDSGSNGQVDYTFAPQTLATFGQLFGIRNSTGEIYVRGSIDHETAAIHQLVVVARDRGSEPYSTEATVIVHVQDVNDNAPVITLHTLSGVPGVAEVAENSSLGSFVAQMTVVDADAGVNGRVNCTLSDQTFALVQKYATEYQILTAAPLDRERTEHYTVTLRCQDGALLAARRVTEKFLRVSVTDINDNAPVFSQQTYRASIIENNYIGASIMQVTATDWDDKDNGRIQYQLLGNLAWQFHVDQRGVISAHTSIDREKYDSFRFPIIAVDMGTPPKTGSALIIISVEDVNDEKPRFTQASYIFSVMENEPAGATVGTLQAVDRDGPSFNSFVYGYLNSETTDTADTFAVDSTTGTVTTKRPLDRERLAQHQFLVVAYDPRFTSLSGTASVVVNVVDKNDNRPEFVHLSRANNSVYLSNRVPVGHVVTEIVVRDADVNENSRIQFKLQDSTERERGGRGRDRGGETGTRGGEERGVIGGGGGGGTAWFRIDPDRGTIYVNAKLSSIEYRTFLLTIIATDSGSPPSSSTADLRVIVNHTIPWGGGASAGGGPTSLQAALQSTHGLVVIVAGSAGCFVVMVTLIVAMVMVRHRDQRRRLRKYNSRMEALKMLTTSADEGGENGIAVTAGSGIRDGGECAKKGGRMEKEYSPSSSPEVSPNKTTGLLLQNGTGPRHRSTADSFEDDVTGGRNNVGGQTWTTSDCLVTSGNGGGSTTVSGEPSFFGGTVGRMGGRSSTGGETTFVEGRVKEGSEGEGGILGSWCDELGRGSAGLGSDRAPNGRPLSSTLKCIEIHAKTNGDVDRNSDQSMDSSVTDSGRGPSEEGGETSHATHIYRSGGAPGPGGGTERHVPPPPPPPRGSYWLQQQQVRGPGSQTNTSHHHQTVRFQGLSTTPEEAPSSTTAVTPHRITGTDPTISAAGVALTASGFGSQLDAKINKLEYAKTDKCNSSNNEVANHCGNHSNRVVGAQNSGGLPQRKKDVRDTRVTAHGALPMPLNLRLNATLLHGSQQNHNPQSDANPSPWQRKVQEGRFSTQQQHTLQRQAPQTRSPSPITHQKTATYVSTLPTKPQPQQTTQFQQQSNPASRDRSANHVKLTSKEVIV